MRVAQPVIDFAGSFFLDPPPGAVWSAIERFDRFETWWPWLSELSVEGPGLESGAVLHGVVAPPVPYRMCIDVELTSCARGRAVDAVVRGDLRGPAHLRLRPEGRGTRAEVDWSVEMLQAPMRLASRFAYPLLRWGHDRVVDATLVGFRRQLEPSNLGAGVGTLSDRRAGASAVRAAEELTGRLRHQGLLTGPPPTLPSGQGRVGGWLKMGMVGTVPARDNVLLVGDAAGLVNPLQGEGIAAALESAAAAADAVLAEPGTAARRYRAELVARHRRFLALGASAQRALLSHPRLHAGTARALTLPGVGRAVARPWAIAWNDLVEGAFPGTARTLADVALATGSAALVRSPARRWFDSAALGDQEHATGRRRPPASAG